MYFDGIPNSNIGGYGMSFYPTQPNTRRGSEWMNMATIDNIDPIRTVSFDKYEELLWLGTENGRISSYLSPQFKKYTSFRAYPQSELVNQLLIEQDHVYSLSSNCVRIHTKGGIPQFKCSDKNFHDLLAFSFQENLTRSKIILGGNINKLYLLDIVEGRVTEIIDITQGCCVMKLGGRYLCCGGTRGELALRDPQSLKVQHKFDVHSGTVSDIAVKGDLLVTCGFANRFGEFLVDTAVKAFDLRTNRLLSQVHFPAGPTFLKFHPMFSSLVCMVSQTGYFQFRDIQADLNHGLLYQIDTQGESINAFDLSSSGDTLVFGDSGGWIHLWSISDTIRINNFSKSTPMPIDIHTYPDFTEDSPLSLIPKEEPTNEVPLSYWPEESYIIGQPTPLIHPQILSNLRYSNNIGYTLNPGISRVQDGYIEHQTLYEYLAQKEKDPNLPPLEMNIIPWKHGKINIKHLEQQKKGFQSLNFSKYNSTRFVGLENQFDNSYINAYIQILYHIEPLRIALANHLCERHYCIACELGLLFQNMKLCENGKTGNTFDARNLIRTFMQMKESKDAGLVENQSNVIPSMALRAQQLNRFLMNEIFNATKCDILTLSPDTTFKKLYADGNFKKKLNMIDILFGSETSTVFRCPYCGNESAKYIHKFLFDLTRVTPVHRDFTFEALLYQTLTKYYKSKAWCPTCGKYRTFDKSKMTLNLPNVLNLNFPLKQDDLYWLRTFQMKDIYGDNITVFPERILLEFDQSSMDWIVESIPFDQEVTDTATRTVYELKAILIEARNVLSRTEGHLLSYIKIDKRWYLFNDFCISHLRNHVLDFKKLWKTPCVLFYERINQSNVPKLEFKNPVQSQTFFFETSLTKNIDSFKSLSIEDLPKKGDIVGIDAECVSLSGRNDVLSLGRVTVIREHDDIPFIDDYIATNEDVHDYLTRFSGLKIGDLDPTTSKHHVTNLKSAYLKVKWLVDRGVIFVGHGLPNDFKLINLVVPKHQMVDTSEIYQLPNQRKISLRFLAKHVLQQDIQIETHCSIEDAKTALALYHKYLEISKNGNFQELLEKIYEIGRNCGWKLE